jgi:hypothetical protein
MNNNEVLILNLFNMNSTIEIKSMKHTTKFFVLLLLLSLIQIDNICNPFPK